MYLKILICDFSVCFQLVSRGAKPRQVYSCADAGGGPYDVGDMPASQSNYRGRPVGRPVGGPATGLDWRQNHRDYATAYAKYSPVAFCGQNATGRLERGGPSGQKKDWVQIKASKDRASTHVQQKPISSSPAAASALSPAMPQSASVNYKMLRSMSLFDG